MVEDQSLIVEVGTGEHPVLQHPDPVGPSVMLLRRAPHAPERQAAVVLAALPDTEESLEVGAMVVVTPGLARVRDLPSGSPGDHPRLMLTCPGGRSMRSPRTAKEETTVTIAAAVLCFEPPAAKPAATARPTARPPR